MNDEKMERQHKIIILMIINTVPTYILECSRVTMNDEKKGKNYTII